MDPVLRLWCLSPDEHRDRGGTHRQAPSATHGGDRRYGQASGDQDVRRQVRLLLASALLLSACSAGPAFVTTTPSGASTGSTASRSSGSVPTVAPSSAPSSPSAVVDDSVVLVGSADIALSLIHISEPTRR